MHLTKRELLLLTLALSLAVCISDAKAQVAPYRLDCDHGKGIVRTESLQGVTVKLVPTDDWCQVIVTDGMGHVVSNDAAPAIQVSSGLRLDKGEGQFLLIQLDTYPYRLVILKLGRVPSKIATLQNRYGFWVQSGCSDRRSHIWTADGAFADDPELTNIYHYDLIVPIIVLSIRGDTVADFTSHCGAYFAGTVSATARDLSRGELVRFKRHQITDSFHEGEIKGKVLHMVLTELYTGHDAMAERLLHQMWPPGDSDRIWSWMVQRRSQGFLAQLQTLQR